MGGVLGSEKEKRSPRAWGKVERRGWAGSCGCVSPEPALQDGWRMRQAPALPTTWGPGSPSRGNSRWNQTLPTSETAALALLCQPWAPSRNRQGAEVETEWTTYQDDVPSHALWYWSPKNKSQGSDPEHRAHSPIRVEDKEHGCHPTPCPANDALITFSDHLFHIRSFSEYPLSTHCVPDTVLGAEEITGQTKPLPFGTCIHAVMG